VSQRDVSVGQLETLGGVCSLTKHTETSF
jgi:hypothetical protein